MPVTWMVSETTAMCSGYRPRHETRGSLLGRGGLLQVGLAAVRVEPLDEGIGVQTHALEQLRAELRGAHVGRAVGMDELRARAETRGGPAVLRVVGSRHPSG